MNYREMETLVVVSHIHNQYQGKSRSYSYGRFRDINCRTFHSDAGILPTPLKRYMIPVTKHPDSSSPSPKTPSPIENKIHSNSKSSAIPININKASNLEMFVNERWAGPAYSTSPPPSSLPIPKFSINPKPSLSLNMTRSPSDNELRTFPHSAPSSPTREPCGSVFFLTADSSTKNLRRILNLDLDDE